MKRMFATVFLAAMAMLVSGKVALACDTVTATITDSSTGTDYAHGGVMMVVDNNFANPIAGSDLRESGGQFSITGLGNIGDARVVISLYRPEGKAPLTPTIRTVMVASGSNPCLHITATVNGGVFTTMRPGGIITF